jgi:threonine dehydrogenase-like Zn-dependent dehydrogenase
MPDMTTGDTYFEHGIHRRHGFLREYFVEEPECLVRLPAGLEQVGVLMEPVSIVVKAVTQAYEIQRRLRVWRPRRAAVLGAGPIGLLTNLLLRLRGLEVVTTDLRKPPFLNADLVEETGARYVNARELTLAEASKEHGPFDLIFEATGHSPLVFEAMEVLAENGVLVMLSITGGERKAEVPSDKINQSFVLGNKVAVGCVSANREHFELGIKELARAEVEYPGWLSKVLTHPVMGLERHEELMRTLTEAEDAIKVFCQVAPA